MTRIAQQHRTAPRRLSALLRTALLTTALAALAACGGDDDNGPSAPTPTGRGTLRVSNVSEISAWYLYVKRCDAAQWGSDRLGSGILDGGESGTIQLDAGCYDLRANSDPDDDKQFERHDLQVTNGNTTQVNIDAWADAQ